jgi:hypothetical protein
MEREEDKEDEQVQLERLENIREGLSDDLSWSSEKEDLLDLLDDTGKKKDTKKTKLSSQAPKQINLFKFYPNIQKTKS